jgi:hypothetical protein
MSNSERKSSEYVYNLSPAQMEALYEIAFNTNRPLLELLMEAVDQYIEREKSSCQS